MDKDYKKRRVCPCLFFNADREKREKSIKIVRNTHFEKIFLKKAANFPFNLLFLPPK